MGKDTFKSILIARGELVSWKLGVLSERKKQILARTAEGEESGNDRLKLLMIEFEHLPYVFQLSVINTLLIVASIADGVQRFIGKNN